MIITTKGATETQLNELTFQMLDLGFEDVRHIIGTGHTKDSDKIVVLHGLGEVPSEVKAEEFLGLDYVIDAKRADPSLPYHLGSRQHHPELGKNGHTSKVKVGNAVFGGASPIYIAGPCAIYNQEQMMETAIAAKSAGAHMLRGGAFKPRTSPHSFQGLGESAIEMLVNAGKETGLPVVSEARSERELEILLRYGVDMIQLGTRNAQNYEFLKEVAKNAKHGDGSGVPVLLKRGLAQDVHTWLGSAEYFLFNDHENVVLCERGVAPTSYTVGRNIPDLAAIIEARHLGIYPVIFDPSHSTGERRFVEGAALSGMQYGAEGLLIDIKRDNEAVAVHYTQDGKSKVATYCDYKQAVTPDTLKSIIERSNRIALENAVAVH